MNNMKLSGQELIENELNKKEKARINTKNYRDKLKKDNPEEYRTNKRIEMQKYCLNVKRRLISSYANNENTGDPQKLKEIAPRIEKIDNDIEEIEEEIRRPSQHTNSLLKRKEAKLKKTPSPY